MPEWTREQQTERVRRRIRAAVDPDSYTYTPPKENNEYAKTNDYQRVAIYAQPKSNFKLRAPAEVL